MTITDITREILFFMKLQPVLRNVVIPTAQATRLGGDEFMVLVRSGDLQTIEKYARKFHKIFSDPFQVASESLMLHCSMGAAMYAMYPHDGDNAFTLLEAADSAMYMVKKSGKDNIVFSWDIC